MLAKRTLTAILLFLPVLGAILLGSLALATLVAVGFAIAGYEYLKMCESAGWRAWSVGGSLLIVLALLDGFVPGGVLARIVLFLLIVAVPTVELFRARNDKFLQSWGLLTLGVLYVGGLGSTVFRLAALPDGLQWVGFTLMATATADTTAFLVGSRWGHRPFFPHISPKKTWEGFFAGLLGAVLAFGLLGSVYGLAPWAAWGGGLGIGLAATLGDMVESLIKRQLGLKDSGSILAGHGGVLDRLDSMLFSMALVYCLAVWVQGRPF